MKFLPWEIWVAFPGESQLQLSHANQLMVHAGCFSVSMINPTLTKSMGYVHTDVNACNCTRGCADTRNRVCTET